MAFGIAPPDAKKIVAKCFACHFLAGSKKKKKPEDMLCLLCPRFNKKNEAPYMVNERYIIYRLNFQANTPATPEF